MSRKRFVSIAFLALVLAIPASLRAGANTWTGGRPVATIEGEPTRIAADPSDPYVVYGAFGPRLYRSRDGGLTWSRLRSFETLRALLVHPASPSTIYVAAAEVLDDEYRDGVWKSTDAGETWSLTIESIYASVLAAGPMDASTVFAGSGASIYKTTDAGATWSGANSLAGWIASLVIHPREPTIAYAGGEGYDYWGLQAGSVVQTTDGGDSWRGVTPNAIEGVSAVAIDSLDSSTVYIGTAPYLYSDSQTQTDVMRSEDGGVTWTSAGAGIRGKTIEVLAVDPKVSGTLYAGTSAGLYRSRDAGRSWLPFGRQLAGTISSLSVIDEGRRLYAGTASGAYELDMVRGPLDVAAGAAGESRVLLWEGERLSIGTVDASGGWSSGAAGATSATWTAVAIAQGGGDRSHVLWQNGDGRSALEIVGPSGRQSAVVFASRADWIPSDLSVGADGRTHVLWTGADGRMFVAEVNASGAATDGPVYGPAPGWSAAAIADGPDGDSWVLWRAADGRWAVSIHRDGVMVSYYVYVAEADWSAEDLAVGADGRPRILRTRPDGAASVATIDGSGQQVSIQSHSLEGLRPRRIAAGADGRTRVLFSGADGHGELLLLDPDNTLHALHVFQP
jgi:hypothetical protein